MSRLQTLAMALDDLVDKADDRELEGALVLCLGFADRITVEPPDSNESIDEPTETTLPRRSNLPN